MRLVQEGSARAKPAAVPLTDVSILRVLSISG
jgi:hypothetical protein